jgi:hypothetical protein
MKKTLLQIKQLFGGKWAGDGLATFPTIDDTAYTEQLEFIPDEYKDALFFTQKTWYKNNTGKNGHTVFWDAGFILLKEDIILLHSTQISGRIEIYVLAETSGGAFTFNSTNILNDPKATRSQRIFTVNNNHLDYQLNMATHAADFQHHLSASLKRTEF